MSLQLSLHLEQPGTVVAVGQEVRGRVELRSEAGAEVRGVRLAVGWRTEGDGNRASGTMLELALLELPAQLRRGETRSLPFRFDAPHGPLSYQGRHLQVVNVVRASADVPWARDPAVEQTYELRRSSDQPGAFQGPLLDPGAQSAGPVRMKAKPRLVEIVLAVLAVLAGLAVGWGAALYGASPPLLTGLLAVSGVAVAAGLLLPFRGKVAERRLGEVELVLDRAVVSPGDTIRAALTFEPRADLRIQRAVATLRGKERVVSGGGEAQRVRQHTFVHAEARLAGETRPDVGAQVVLWAPLELAPQCPCSFRAKDNRLDWEVEVRIAIAGWPDWVAVHPVLVWPARAGVPARG
jgi:hypothetical protein